MFFYEIHEADDELALGVTLAHEDRIDAHDFLAMVEEARKKFEAGGWTSMSPAVAATPSRG